MSLPSLLPTLVPLFPLPEVALFPRQVLPLHIFEPRYREMVCDALNGDGQIAIAMLKSGYEEHYFTPHAPIHKVVGIGQIVTAEQMEDGRYNLLLRGVSRGRVQREFHDRSYRVAEVRRLESCCTLTADQACVFRKQLWRLITEGGICSSASRDALARLFEADISLGVLVDLLASGAPVDCELRQNLLEELDDRRRTEQLLESLTVVNAIHHAQQASRGAGAYHPN
jgi:Lon protease-like protein